MDYELLNPEKYVKGLIYSPVPKGWRGQPPQIREALDAKKRIDSHPHPPPADPLCWACGWTAYWQIFTSYAPRVKIFHARANMGLWSLGDRWLLRDAPRDATAGNDYMTQQFLRAQPGLTVPLVEKMWNISEPSDNIQFTLISKAQGVTLYSIWHTLSPEEKLSCSKQLASSLKQIRQFTAPTPQKVDGTLLDDPFMFICSPRPPTCKKIGRTTEEWWESSAEELRHAISLRYSKEDAAFHEAKYQELWDNFPKGGPYVLTHGDLNTTNIMYKDGKIEALVDWEYAGYFPWWAERLMSSLCSTSTSQDELFGPIWAEVQPELDEATFIKTVYTPVATVKQTFSWCHAEHADQERWFKPPFCECRPYGGEIRMWELNRTGHRIRTVDDERRTRAEWDHKQISLLMKTTGCTEEEATERHHKETAAVAEKWERLLAEAAMEAEQQQQQQQPPDDEQAQAQAAETDKAN